MLISKIIQKLFFLLILAAFSFFGFFLIKKGGAAHNKYEELKELKNKIFSLEKENSRLRAEIKFFNNPDNLEKEARSVLNYKSPGEKMAVIVNDKNINQPDGGQNALLSEYKFTDKLKKWLNAIF